MGSLICSNACIFPLATPLNCDEAAQADGKGCDCFMDDLASTGPFVSPQVVARRHQAELRQSLPGTRHLQCCKSSVITRVVASICPRSPTTIPSRTTATTPRSVDHRRLKEALKGKCLPRPLVPNDTDMVQVGLEPGQVPCAVIEAVLPQNGAACACDANQNRLSLDGSDGRDAKPELRDAVLAKLRAGQSCDGDGQTACASFCTCELAQLKGGQLESCQNDSTPPNVPGYCYVNAAPTSHSRNPDWERLLGRRSACCVRGDTPVRAIALGPVGRFARLAIKAGWRLGGVP